MTLRALPGGRQPERNPFRDAARVLGHGGPRSPAGCAHCGADTSDRAGGHACCNDCCVDLHLTPVSPMARREAREALAMIGAANAQMRARGQRLEDLIDWEDEDGEDE